MALKGGAFNPEVYTKRLEKVAEDKKLYIDYITKFDFNTLPNWELEKIINIIRYRT